MCLHSASVLSHNEGIAMKLTLSFEDSMGDYADVTLEMLEPRAQKFLDLLIDSEPNEKVSGKLRRVKDRLRETEGG